MAQERDSFMADSMTGEYENTNIFSFLDLDDGASLLRSPSLPMDDLLYSPHLSSDLSSPDISSPDHQLSPHLLSDPSLDSYLAINMMGDDETNSLSVIDQLNTDVEREGMQEVRQPEVDEQKKPGKRGRGKKRQRSDPNESKDTSAVALTREQTLSFSSEDMDGFIEQITKVRPLSHAEEKEVKLQRRLIKNRESAQASRQRKKAHVDELEAQIHILKQHNSQLSTQVNQLVHENKSLREELQKLHTLVKKTVVGNVIPDVQAMRPIQPKHPEQHGSHATPAAKANAGVCLLIVLFSFGLFFNLERGPARAYLAQSKSLIPKVIEAAPGMALGPKVFFSGEANSVRGGMNRRLLEETREPQRQLPSEPVVTAPQVPVATEQIVKPVFEAPHKHANTPVHKITINDRSSQMGNVDMKRRTVQTPAASYYEEIAERKKDAHLGVNFVEFMNESINSNVSEMQDGEMRKWFSDRLKVRPNTAFFTVSDFQQIIPPNAQPFDSNSPFFVSLLVPASSLMNGLPSTAGHVVDNSVFEVIAQVVDVNRTSMNLDEVTKIRQVPIVA